LTRDLAAGKASYGDRRSTLTGEGSVVWSFVDLAVGEVLDR
jgi:hypothetical protein